MWNNVHLLSTMTEYYYLNAQHVPQGPHTLDELASMMASGRVNPTTLVACKGAASWEPLGSVLSRENIQAPNTSSTQGCIGACPSCKRELGSDSEGGQLPIHCPGCHRTLRTEKGGIWANFRLALSNYTTFSGRATRAEYWSFQLINFVVLLVLYMGMLVVPLVWLMKQSSELETQMQDMLAQEKVGEALLTVMDKGGLLVGMLMLGAACALILWSLAMLIPNLSVTVRRLHDIGWSGWWLALYAFTSIVLPFLLLGSILLPGGESHASMFFMANKLLSYANNALGIFLFVLMVLDSKRGSNKYGPSAKYPLG